MKYLKNIKYLPVIVSVLFSVTSCDWVKGMMGMPTSGEIEEMRVQLQEQQRLEIEAKQREQKIQDSIRLSMEAAQKAPKEGYYLVMGCFKEEKNADSMLEDLKKRGYSAGQLGLKNGYTMVAVGAYKTYLEAFNELVKLSDDSICPYDVWIYNTNQGLHN